MEEKLQILIIDDDLIDRRAIARALRKSVHEVEIGEADSIRQAWEKIGLQPWDCVFLDYMLPGGDGLELLRLFRQKGFAMPVIMITSQGDEKIAVEVMRGGGSDYITKNLIDSEAVATVLRNAIRTFRAEEEGRKTAKALAESESRLAEAQRIANLGSWEWNVGTENEYWTEQVFHIFGRSDGSNRDMPAHSFLQHLHRDSREKFIAAFQQCVHDRKHFKVDLRIVKENGEIVPVEMQGKPVFEVGGALTKVIGTLQDISARKQIEQELLDARDLAERNALAKQEFLANMSHEIRTPMNAIMGFAKLLIETDVTPQQAEYLHAIDESGATLLYIINDILDLSKIESGKMQFEAAPFKPADLLRSLTEIFKAKAAEKGLGLHTMLGPGVPATLLGDISRLKQVLLNLIGNALKFTETGEVNIEIKLIDQHDHQAKILFEVSDTGIGIPKEKQQAIFESFTQASSDTTRKFGGTGLGLTISKRIVEMQGGKIGLESQVGTGSTFFFDLTFAVPDAKGEKTEPTQIQPKLSKVAQRSLKVMVVEDNTLNQRLATIVLGNLGHTFVIAKNGLEALDLIVAERPDLVLMDVQMPVMDGLEATRCIRQMEDPRIQNTPIIALSAHALRAEIDKCFEAGMNAFLAKPFHAAQLQAKISELIPEAAHQAQTSKSIPDAPDQTATAAPAPASLDLTALQEMVGQDKKFRAELTDIFLTEVPKAITQLQAAITATDSETIRKVAHSMKPSLLLFGVPGAKALMTDLEAAVKQGKDFPIIAALVHTLVQISQDACRQLRHG